MMPSLRSSNISFLQEALNGSTLQKRVARCTTRPLPSGPLYYSPGSKSAACLEPSTPCMSSRRDP